MKDRPQSDRTDATPLPPHDPENEKRVLGCFFLRDEAFTIADEANLEPLWFFEAKNKQIWKRIESLPNSGLAIQPAFYVRQHGRDDLEYIMGCMDLVEHPLQFEVYLQLLKDDRERRMRLAEVARIELALYDKSIPPSELALIATEILKPLSEASRNGTVNDDLSIHDAEEILSMEFSPTDRIIGDYLIVKGQLTVFAGEAGVGKSRVLTQMAAYSVINREIFGFVTRGEGLSWLFIQTENASRRLRNDLAGLKIHMGKDWATVKEHLRWHTLTKDTDGYVTLDDPNNIARIRRAIKSVNPDVVVFDPLRAFGMGDLNTDVDMVRTVQTLQMLTKEGNHNRTPIIVHHAGTGSAGAAKAVGWDKGTFSRNSKALTGIARAQVNIAPGDPDDTNRLLVACGKCSDGRPFDPMGILLNENLMVYAPDPNFSLVDWKHSVGIRQPKNKKTRDDFLADSCALGIDQSTLIAEIMKFGVHRQNTYPVIERLVKKGWIIYDPVFEKYSKNPKGPKK